MTDRNRAGDNARTDSEAPPPEKPDGLLLADGGTAARPNGGAFRVPELPGIQRDILLTLARAGPTHGAGLKDDLGCLRDANVTDGSLYPNLNQLVDAGLVEKRENRHDERSHEFVLSDAGRDALKDHAGRVSKAADAADETPVTDGGFEFERATLRDGQPRDDSHAARNAALKRSLRRDNR